MTIDFHSHVLPGIDDGSRDNEMSIEMLHESYRQGIDVILATSHFYAYENSPKQYLESRDRALFKLLPYLDEEMPKLLPGAEVQYFEGISRAEDLSLLKVSGTDLLLLEMPFSRWSDRMVKDVKMLAKRPHMTVLLAHIERYLGWQDMDVFEELRDAGVLMQVNASFFIRRGTRKQALRMLAEGMIDVLGSDTHNMAERRQNLQEAREVIGRKLGKEALAQLDERGKAALGMAR